MKTSKKLECHHATAPRLSLIISYFLTILLQVPEVTTNNGTLSCDTRYDGACIDYRAVYRDMRAIRLV